MMVALALAVGSCGDSGPIPASRAPSGGLPPNIVVIVGDDVGWTEHGFLGNDRIVTPNLDALAKEGVTFPHGQLWASVCHPTHLSMLTGVPPEFLTEPLATWPTLPRILSRDGPHSYRTFQAGKLWAMGPQEWGFQEHAGNISIEEGRWGARRGSPEWGRKEWNADHCGSRGDAEIPCAAMHHWHDFLDSVAEDVERNPFLALLTPEIPHGTKEAPQPYSDLYRDVPLREFEREYYPVITWLDEVVFEILEALEKRGLRENTLIVYFVDNGYNAKFWLDAFHPEENRGKASLSELGFRTPVIFAGPGVAAGDTYPDLVSLADIFTTIARIARVPKEAFPTVRGYDLTRRLRNEAPASPRTAVLAEMNWGETHGIVVRTPQWRYIRDINRGEIELYAIDEDPHEEVNLADAVDPETLDAFEDLFDTWQQTRSGDPAP
jgi:uncharacterized sulfatase